MQKSLVRCWKIINWQRNNPNELFLSYPEDNRGHSLISCLKCGHIYAVSESRRVYRGPALQEKLKNRM